MLNCSSREAARGRFVATASTTSSARYPARCAGSTTFEILSSFIQQDYLLFKGRWASSWNARHSFNSFRQRRFLYQFLEDLIDQANVWMRKNGNGRAYLVYQMLQDAWLKGNEPAKRTNGTMTFRQRINVRVNHDLNLIILQIWIRCWWSRSMWLLNPNWVTDLVTCLQIWSLCWKKPAEKDQEESSALSLWMRAKKNCALFLANLSPLWL